MNKQRMRFAVGLVTVMAAFGLSAITIWFGEFQNVVKRKRKYTFVFERAPGIQPQVPVRRAGMKIGEVNDVEFSEEHNRVGVSVTLEGNNQLREGDYPVVRRELLGDAYVEIETVPEKLQQRGRTAIPENSTIEGKSGASAGDAAAVLAELAPNLNRALVSFDRLATKWADFGDRADKLLAGNEDQINRVVLEAREALELLTETLDGIGMVFDEKSRNNLQETIANARTISRDLMPAAEASQNVIAQFNETLEALETLCSTLTRITKPLADRGDKLAVKLEEGLNDLLGTLDDVRGITSAIRTKDGTLQRLMTDPSLYQNLNDASARLVEGVDQLQIILRDGQVLSDKLARHPGELGVQGIFTRDKGLKGTPSADGKSTTGRSSRLLPPNR